MPRPPRQTRRRHTRHRRDPTYRGKRIDRASCLRLAREIPEPKYPDFRRSVRTQLPATGYPYKPRPADTPVDVTNELFDLIDDARASSSSRSPRGRSTRRRRPRGPKRTWRRTAKKVAKYVLFGALLAFAGKKAWEAQQELEGLREDVATLKRGVAPVGGPAAGVGAVVAAAAGVVGAGSGTKGGKMDDDIQAIFDKARAIVPNILFAIELSNSKSELVCYAPNDTGTDVDVFTVDCKTSARGEAVDNFQIRTRDQPHLPFEMKLTAFENKLAPPEAKKKSIRVEKSQSGGEYVARTTINNIPGAVVRVVKVYYKTLLGFDVPRYIELWGENGEFEVIATMADRGGLAAARRKEYAQAHP